MSKFRTPTAEEEKILRRNGIDPVGLAVTCRSEDSIRLMRLKTRDEISVHMGTKNWKDYQD